MAATLVGPIRERQLNNYLYVGEAGFPNIQATVNYAVAQGGEWCVVIPHGYPDSDLIASITGGSTAVNLHDERDARLQVYAWQGTYYRPEPFLQKLGFIATGEPPEVPASMVMGFDPAGTNGVGTANLRVSANPGKPLPSWQVLLEPQDGSGAPWTIIRASGYSNGTGFPRIQMEAAVEITTASQRWGDKWQLWCGELPDAGSFGIPGRGMYVWSQAPQNLTDIQGYTASTGLYDQTIRLNALGGNLQLGMNGSLDQSGNLNVGGNIIAQHRIKAYGWQGGPPDITASNANLGTGSDGTTPVFSLINSLAGMDTHIWTNAVRPTRMTWSAVADSGADNYWMWADRVGVNVTLLTIVPDVNIQGSITAGDASFASCLVDGSPVVTQAQIPPGSFVYPPAGIAVSTGDAWDVSIDPATVVVTNPTSDTIIDRGWHIFQIKGSAPPPVPGNGGSSGGSNPQAYIQLQGPTGQDTTGTTGQTAGNGGSALMGGGQGGAAPAGSTNGNGGPLYLSGGRSGQGAGAPGVGGDVLINNNWGNTYIGGSSQTTGCMIAHGGAIVTPSEIWSAQIHFTPNNNSNGLSAGTYGGALGWNIGGANETDFLNANNFGTGTVAGGFRWYNGPPGTTFTSSSVALMTLDSNGTGSFMGGLSGAWLDVWGATGPANVDPNGNGHVRIGQGGEGSTCIYMTRGGGTANQHIWGMVAWDNVLRFTLLSDDQSVNNVWMQVQRSGATPTQVNFGTNVTIPPGKNISYGSVGQQIWSDNTSLMIDGQPGHQIVLNYNNGNPGGQTIVYGPLINEGPIEANSSIRSTGIIPTPQYPTNISHVTMGLINGAPSFPILVHVNASAPVDSKAYQNFVDNSGTMHYQLVNDADNVGTDWMKVDRIGTNNFTITVQGSTVCGYTLKVNNNFQVGAGGNFTVNLDTSQINCWNQLICNSGLNVTQGGKNFRIVHPHDEEKYLFHSCIEGPEIAVFYRGEVVLTNGEAVVALPDYFEALTFEEERSVLLTQVDDDKELAVMAASRIVKGKFRIRASVADATVAWEVKAVRRLGVDRLEVVTARDRASEARNIIAPAPPPLQEQTA